MGETEKESKKERRAEVILPLPPDGGWGWVVVFGSFMIHVIADGVAYSFGIFYIEFLDYFQGGRGETGWIGSLMVGITWASGPLASALTNKYGCRAVTVAGSIIASIGFIISIFAPNIWFLYFSFGIVGGIGLGLIYLPAIVSVTYYFERRRSFATGLAVCGSGLGTFIFAPFTKYLVSEYSWKGAVLILAGLLLNCILCGALFRPLEPVKTSKTEDETDPPLPPPMEEVPLSNGHIKSESNLKINGENGGMSNGGVIPAVMVTAVKSSSQKSFHSMQAIDQATVDDAGNLRSYASDHLLHRRVRKTSENKPTASPMVRKDIFYARSLQNIPMYRSNPGLYTQSIMSIPKEMAAEEKECKMFKCSDEMKQTFKDMMDFSLLKDPLFVMFAISNFLTSIGFCIPYIFLPDRAGLMGIDENSAAFLISVIGIANTVGRVVFGFLSDRKFVNRLYLYNIALTMCGVCTSLSAFCVTYELMVAYAAAFGVSLGVYVSLTSVVLVDLLGLECLTSSFGLTLLFQGIAGVIGPPIAGSIFDATGDYDLPFYIMGAIIAVSGLMLFFIPCVQRYQEHKDTVTQHDMDMGRVVSDGAYVASTLHVNDV